MSGYVLVPKNDFDNFEPSIKAGCLNASTSFSYSQIPVYTFSNVSYYLFEIEEEALAWFTVLINYPIKTEVQIKGFIATGVYDPNS